MSKLIEDISAITTLPIKTLDRLFDKGAECICHSVLESKLNGESVCSIDISVGEIKVIISNDTISYRFIPSNKLEAMLVDTIVNNNDPLVKDIEDTLINRILNTYKDLV